MEQIVSKRTALLTALAEIVEAPVTPETVLDEGGSWNSVAVVMAVGEIDLICGVVVDGVKLSQCRTIAEVLVLAGCGEEQSIGADDVGRLDQVLG